MLSPKIDQKSVSFESTRLSTLFIVGQTLVSIPAVCKARFCSWYRLKATAVLMMTLKAKRFDESNWALSRNWVALLLYKIGLNHRKAVARQCIFAPEEKFKLKSINCWPFAEQHNDYQTLFRISRPCLLAETSSKSCYKLQATCVHKPNWNGF